uniref:NADH dehydrogenase [ubiquinone] 1 beta subcomplex subunit 11, mitochondrial n=1 Tax=Parastrongyloides trichosuri TaxID=131310 RepID=A0A0N4ZDT3_PARTI
MLKCTLNGKGPTAVNKILSLRSLASHGHGDKDANIVRNDPNYRPGSDSYAYENPWPKLNGGRLDWMFGDGWRRPLAKDQGGKMRKEWLWFGQVSHDEHKDWVRHHKFSFMFFTVLTVWTTCWIIWLKPDWPNGREWALREAHLEIARREKAGLPYISKDFINPERVAASIPSDEELRDFEILI